MAQNFPNSPIENDEVTINNITYTFINGAWQEKTLNDGVNPSDADATVYDVKTGKTFFANNSTLRTGVIPETDPFSQDIENINDIIDVHNIINLSSGIVQISSTEKAKIIADNIKSGISFLGVSGNYPVEKHEVRWFDYDGTLLKTEEVDDGSSATPPTTPDHTSINLTFDGWNLSYSSITHDLDICAIFSTTDGKTYFYIAPNQSSDLTINLNFEKDDTSEMTIDWGDTNSETTSVSGEVELSHTYASIGFYTITVWISSGTGNYSFGHSADSGTKNYVIEQDILNECYIGNNVLNLYQSCFSYTDIYILTIPEGVTNISKKTFAAVTNLDVIGFPTTARLETATASQAGLSMFDINYAYVISFNENFFQNETYIGDYFFRYCYNLEKIILPLGVKRLGTNVIFDCHRVEYIHILGLEYLDNMAFDASHIFFEDRKFFFNKGFFDTMIYIGDTQYTETNRFFSQDSYIKIPSGFTGTYNLENLHDIEVLDFSDFVVSGGIFDYPDVPSASVYIIAPNNANYTMGRVSGSLVVLQDYCTQIDYIRNFLIKKTTAIIPLNLTTVETETANNNYVYVPDVLYNDYINDANWGSAISQGYCTIYKSSEYQGKLK